MKFLDYSGLQRFLDRLKAIIPTKTSDIQNDSGYLNTQGVQDYMENGGGYSQSEANTLLASKADSVHTHGNITNDGKVGTAANKPLITGTGGVVQTGSFGNAANTFCEGNDSRLSDARTPVAHTHLTSDVTDLLNSQHTWASQQSYSSDLNLNYASTDVDDIVNSVAGSATLDNFVHLTGNETVNGIKSFPNGIVANVTGNVTGTAAEFSTNKSITLTGLIEGTASSKGGWTIPTSFRYGYGGRSGSTTEEYVKLVSGTVSGPWNVYNAIFLCNADERFETCFLQLSIFVNQEGNIDSPTSARLFVKSLVGLSIGRLFLGYKNNSGSVSFEIYGWNYTNQGIRLQLLSEFIRRNSKAERTINLHTNVNISSIPSEGFTLVNGEPATIRNNFSPFSDNAYNLGTSTNKWKSFNGVNPGALSFPDYDNAAKIDISGSITPDQNGNIFYTPTINGWLYVCYDMSNATTNDSIFYIQAKDNNVANSNFVQTERIPTSWSTSSLSIIFPVVANKQFIMQINFSNYTIIKAHIIPCLGNV